MPIIIQQHWYTREEIRANPDNIYIFGDNVARVGLGGQAKEARGEPNTFGIPTLWSPDLRFGQDIKTEAVIIQLHLFEIRFRSDSCYQTFVYPADGVGTGIARLPDELQTLINEFFNV